MTVCIGRVVHSAPTHGSGDFKLWRDIWREDLERLAEKMPGVPVMYEHLDHAIGEVQKAFVDADGSLMIVYTLHGREAQIWRKAIEKGITTEMSLHHQVFVGPAIDQVNEHGIVDRSGKRGLVVREVSIVVRGLRDGTRTCVLASDSKMSSAEAESAQQPAEAKPEAEAEAKPEAEAEKPDTVADDLLTENEQLITALNQLKERYEAERKRAEEAESKTKSFESEAQTYKRLADDQLTQGFEELLGRKLEEEEKRALTTKDMQPAESARVVQKLGFACSQRAHQLNMRSASTLRQAEYRRKMDAVRPTVNEYAAPVPASASGAAAMPPPAQSWQPRKRARAELPDVTKPLGVKAKGV